MIENEHSTRDEAIPDEELAGFRSEDANRLSKKRRAHNAAANIHSKVEIFWIF